MDCGRILGKSLMSNKDKKKIGYWGLMACFIIGLTSLFSLFQTFFSNNVSLYAGNFENSKMIQETREVAIEMRHEIKQKTVCNLLEPKSDFCDINGDIRIHGKSSTIFFNSSPEGFPVGNELWKIKPYARKDDKTAMRKVNELVVKSFLESDKQTPQCSINHSVPGIIFSSGGYAGNQFHAFSEVLIPLFLTSHQFHQEVQFLVTDSSTRWVSKYEEILKQLSRYPIIHLDKENNVHCFQTLTIGLKYHKDMGIDPLKSPKGYSMNDFNQLLRNSYSLERSFAIELKDYHNKTKKPRLLIVSRKRTRKFTNEDEIVSMAKSLGYQVIVAEPGVTMNSSTFAKIVNSCDVLIGVHGAGLTNFIFLPTNGIVIQVIPLGGLEWFSKHCYGKPAEEMGLRYLEYKIREDESTLIEQYPIDHVVFKDPYSFGKQGWSAVKSVYLDKQDVKLDVGRFRDTLVKALNLLHSKSEV